MQYLIIKNPILSYNKNNKQNPLTSKPTCKHPNGAPIPKIEFILLVQVVAFGRSRLPFSNNTTTPKTKKNITIPQNDRLLSVLLCAMHTHTHEPIINFAWRNEHISICLGQRMEELCVVDVVHVNAFADTTRDTFIRILIYVYSIAQQSAGRRDQVGVVAPPTTTTTFSSSASTKHIAPPLYHIVYIYKYSSGLSTKPGCTESSLWRPTDV